MRATFLLCSTAAALLTAARPVAACSWAHAPEPLGDTSALFIGSKMMEAAAYVDVAVPESIAPVQLPTGTHGFVKSVTFRVVERLKGSSPERFQLFATGMPESAPGRPAAPLMHWVDEASGVVYPFGTPGEPSPDPDMSFTSCDPGFIEPVRGRRYLVLRGRDGGLLGPVQFAPNLRPARGYAFVEAEGASDSPWVRSVRFLAAGRARAASEPPSPPPPPPPPAVAAAPVSASVSFRRLLSDDEVRRLLERAGARPYEVFMRAGTYSGVHRVAPERASADVIAGARAQARETVGSGQPSGGVVARARHALDGASFETFAADPQKLSYARALVGSHDAQIAAAAAVRGGAPMIYGVEFVGGPEARAALARSPLVHAVTPGLAVRGRVSVPDPENAASPDPAPLSPKVRALTARELYARLRQLADSPLPDRPTPEGRPR